MSKYKYFHILLLSILVYIPFHLSAEEVVLQNGLNGYAGCEDSWFEKGREVYGASTDLSPLYYYCQS